MNSAYQRAHEQRVSGGGKKVEQRSGKTGRVPQIFIVEKLYKGAKNHG